MNAHPTPSSIHGTASGLRFPRPHHALLIAILIATALVYWPGLWGGFSFDDNSNIVFNTQLHVSKSGWDQWVAAAFSSPAKELPRPLAMLSFAVNHFFTGLNPWPMKATNLAIHLTNTALVFGLVRAMVRSSGRAGSNWSDESIALFVSACWALMPINLMAVLLVVQRMEILSHTFVFLGLWLYLQGRQRQLLGRNGWAGILAGLVLCTAVGAMSKESAVLLPLYAFVTEALLLKFRGPNLARDNRLLTLFGVVLVVPAIVAVSWLLPKSLDPASFAHRNFSLIERLLTEPHVVADYLRWTLLPDLNRLSLFHDDFPVSRGLLTPPSTLFSMLGLLAVALLAWRFRISRPLAALGIGWFFAAQLLTATFIPLELMFEHRNYFASLGISLLIADLLLIAPSKSSYRVAGSASAVFLLLLYAGSCHLRALEWSNPIRFAQTEAAKHPDSPRATYNLGQMLAILSKGAKESPFTPAAFEAFDRARKVPNAGILPAQGALLLAARSGTPQRDEWWQEIQHRLERNPIGPQELGALGALTGCAISGKCAFPPPEMLAMFTAALRQGDNPEVLNIYANYALNVLDDSDLAMRLYRGATTLNPSEPEYQASVVKLLIALGRYEEADAEIGRLRGLGRFGQYGAMADRLEARLRAAMRGQDNPPPAQAGRRLR